MGEKHAISTEIEVIDIKRQKIPLIDLTGVSDSETENVENINPDMLSTPQTCELDVPQAPTDSDATPIREYVVPLELKLKVMMDQATKMCKESEEQLKELQKLAKKIKRKKAKNSLKKSRALPTPQMTVQYVSPEINNQSCVGLSLNSPLTTFHHAEQPSSSNSTSPANLIEETQPSQQQEIRGISTTEYLLQSSNSTSPINSSSGSQTQSSDQQDLLEIRGISTTEYLLRQAKKEIADKEDENIQNEAAENNNSPQTHVNQPNPPPNFIICAGCRQPKPIYQNGLCPGCFMARNQQRSVTLVQGLCQMCRFVNVLNTNGRCKACHDYIEYGRSLQIRQNMFNNRAFVPAQTISPRLIPTFSTPVNSTVGVVIPTQNNYPSTITSNSTASPQMARSCKMCQQLITPMNQYGNVKKYCRTCYFNIKSGTCITCNQFKFLRANKRCAACYTVERNQVQVTMEGSS